MGYTVSLACSQFLVPLFFFIYMDFVFSDSARSLNSTCIRAFPVCIVPAYTMKLDTLDICMNLFDTEKIILLQNDSILI